MSAMGDKVSQKPKTTIAVILVLTIILTYFGSSFQNDVDPESFNPDHELIKASEEAGDTFGTKEYNLLVIVRKNDNNVLQMEDMRTLIEFENTIRSNEEVASFIVPSQNNPTGFSSLADLMVLGYGLYLARTSMDFLLMGFDQGLTELLVVLENATESNITKTYALDAALISLNENLTSIKNADNGMIPQFNKTQYLATLDAISSEYGPDPVPSFIHGLENYDIAGATEQTYSLINSIDSSISTIMSYLVLLNGTVIDQISGTEILMVMDFLLQTLQAQAESIDNNILDLYYGAEATLTRDFGENGGVSAKGTIISINFNVDLNKEQRTSIENEVYDIAKGQVGDLEYGILGDQLINDEIEESMDISQMFLLILVFLLIVLILFGTYRSGFDTVLTLLSLGMAIIWSYGIAVVIGLEGSIISTVVPILLVGLGVDYGIHMTMRFREEKGKGSKNYKAIAISIGTVGMALLLATVTTSIGFMSNTVSSLTVLRDFAIMVTAGIVASFIIMTTFLPAVRLVASERRDRKEEKKEKKKDSKGNNMKNNSKRHAISVVTIGAKAGDRAPWVVLILLIIISSITAYGASQLDTVFDFREFIPRDTEAYDNYVFLIDEFEFGDIEYGEFYIKGDVANPEVLRAMDETIINTQDDEQVFKGNTSRSILSVMQYYANPTQAADYNQSYIENWSVSHTDSDGIPDSNIKTLIDILYNFKESSSEIMSVIHKNGDGNYDAALIQLRVTSENLKKADVIVRELEEDAAPLYELVDDGILEKVWIIGEPVVINVVITEMNEGQIRSIIITIAASFIVLTIVFFLLERSFILGLITIIPVVLVILWILGSMILFGYTLNVMTITIASLTVGMGITYSIHVSERFTEDLKKFKTPGEACENTLTHTGMALAGAFLTTAGGFGVLYFHKLPPLQQFGVLIALSITYSFLASAYVLPTFLILWAKWRNNYRTKRGIREEFKKESEEPEEQKEVASQSEEEGEDEKSEGEEMEEDGIERDETEEEKDNLKEEPDKEEVKVKDKKD